MCDKVNFESFEFNQNTQTKRSLRLISHSTIIYLNHINVSYQRTYVGD